VFASFVFAFVVEVVGFTPGGLGTFEAACVGGLHAFGVGFAPALAATLVLRGLTYWLPMLPGVLIWRHELARER
ncbi:MAG TPA: lysylphosphatidylglycerol synthase domain-containing protein, partial [Minicystis sp.]|nr:lysylphosphatidylglycerol synthase domain-containing protein [Minicystis sp.]